MSLFPQTALAIGVFLGSGVGAGVFDPDLTLHYNFLRDSGSAISAAVVLGPTPTFTRASSSRAFGSDGFLSEVTTDNPRFEHDPANGDLALGLLVEEQRTNEALWNRDCTDVAWVKSDITAVLDATGLDGVANSASTLTATAANGTCLQTVTKASAENTYSVWVKRVTGSGDIDITDDNGVSWTTLTGLSSSDWTRHDITRTQTNPVFGIRIVTDTDAVEVDMNQLEVGAIPSSAIPTTTISITRAEDVCNTADVTWFDETKGTLFTQGSFPTVDRSSGAAQSVFTIDDGAFTDFYRIAWSESFGASGEAIGELVSAAGNDGLVVVTDPFLDGVSFRAAVAYAQDDVHLAMDGSLGTPDATFDVSAGTFTTARIGTAQFGHIANGHVARVKYWNVRKPNAFLIAETA